MGWVLEAVFDLIVGAALQEWVEGWPCWAKWAGVILIVSLVGFVVYAGLFMGVD